MQQPNAGVQAAMAAFAGPGSQGAPNPGAHPPEGGEFLNWLLQDGSAAAAAAVGADGSGGGDGGGGGGGRPGRAFSLAGGGPSAAPAGQAGLNLVSTPRGGGGAPIQGGAPMQYLPPQQHHHQQQHPGGMHHADPYGDFDPHGMPGAPPPGYPEYSSIGGWQTSQQYAYPGQQQQQGYGPNYAGPAGGGAPPGPYGYPAAPAHSVPPGAMGGGGGGPGFAPAPFGVGAGPGGANLGSMMGASQHIEAPEDYHEKVKKDERRKERNRESSRKLREKHKKYVEELEGRVNEMDSEIIRLRCKFR